MKRFICAILTACMLLSFNVVAQGETETVNFTDVKPGAWYATAVTYCCENGIFNGMSETTFEPETAISRGMFVTILGRFSGIADDKEASTIFTDVPAGKYYSGHVKWAFEANIVNGTSPTTFKPDQPISRQDMCVMIRRYCNFMGIELTEKTGDTPIPTFDDEASIAKYAKESINNMVRAGLVNGMGTVFNPKGTSTRAQAATIMMRLDELKKSQVGATRLVDGATGLVIEYEPESGLDPDTELSVIMTQGFIPNELEDDKTYTITLYKNGEVVRPTAPVKIKIPVVDGSFARERSIFTLTRDKIMIAQEYSIENGYYTFDFMCNTDIITGFYGWTKNY